MPSSEMSKKFVNPLSEADEDGAASPISDATVDEEGTVAHAFHKVAESLSRGVDPYVKIYCGHRSDGIAARTRSVVASSGNNHGRDPTWTEKENNMLVVTPLEVEEFLTVEVWDSDIDDDDFLGGRQVELDYLRMMGGLPVAAPDPGRLSQRELAENHHDGWDNVDGELSLQLYEEGGGSGRDAGVLRVACTWDTNLDPPRLQVEVKAAVDLLSDTPDIRDMSTFSDWQTVRRALVALALYMTLGTVFFAWFFNAYACGGLKKCLPHDAPLCGTPTEADGSDVGNATAECYPNKNHPALDAGLFMLSMATTTGWGTGPVDLTQRYYASEYDVLMGNEGVAAAHSELEELTPDQVSHNQVLAATKAFLAFYALLGIIMIGIFFGSLGSSIRALLRKQVHDALVEATVKRTRRREGLLERHPFILAVVLLVLVVIFGMFILTLLEEECRDTNFAIQDPDCPVKIPIPYVDAIYFTVISISTVGFGDYSPTSWASKCFFLLYLPLAVTFAANAIDTVSQAIRRHRKRELEKHVLMQFGRQGADSARTDAGLTAYDFEQLQRSVNVDHKIPMTRNDFRLAMLLRLARIEPSDLGSIDSVFSELDEDGSGTLDPNDVVHHQEDALRHRIARLDELTGKKHDKGKHGKHGKKHKKDAAE